ncbi:fasciclin-like arabinogalactan protein 19 [Euphorbia lathyris]|uniref:fasciclin-like arabinogalactan protein 19 n=1 Tax=Euphorbia lathyris TaxID=212925 RepID=UPI00331310C4
MAPILFLLLSLTLLSTASANVTVQELDAALSALRSRGYTLFPNAISTSDIGLFLLSRNSSFTLFSPPDLLVFSLDLSSTATDYVHYLLRHVVPHRLSMAQLRSIRGNNPYLDTLVTRNRLLIDKSAVVVANGTVLESVLVDGVRVLNPDLFLGSSIAVHGLGGILVSEFGSGVEEGKIDNFVDSPVMSPVAWAPELNSPAPSPAAGGGGDFIMEPRGKKMEGQQNHNHRNGNNLGVHVNLGGMGDGEGVADGDYALFSHLFGG